MKPSWRPRASQVRGLVMGLQGVLQGVGRAPQRAQGRVSLACMQTPSNSESVRRVLGSAGEAPGATDRIWRCRPFSAVRELQPGLKERTSQSLDV